MSNPQMALEPPDKDGCSFLAGANLSGCASAGVIFAMLVCFSLDVMFPGGVDNTLHRTYSSEHEHWRSSMGLSYFGYHFKGEVASSGCEPVSARDGDYEYARDVCSAEEIESWKALTTHPSKHHDEGGDHMQPWSCKTGSESNATKICSACKTSGIIALIFHLLAVISLMAGISLATRETCRGNIAQPITSLPIKLSGIGTFLLMLSMVVFQAGCVAAWTSRVEALAFGWSPGFIIMLAMLGTQLMVVLPCHVAAKNESKKHRIVYT